MSEEHNHDHQQQEFMFKLAMYEQQIKQLQEQLEAVEKAIIDSSALSLNLESLKGGKGKEIVASIGKGIFAKANLASDELLVDVGNKNIVKKSIPEAQNLISKQISKLEEIKKELERNLEQINSELMKIFLEAQEKQ